MWEMWKQFNLIYRQQEENLEKQRANLFTAPLQSVYPNVVSHQQISLNDEPSTLLSQQQSQSNGLYFPQSAFSAVEPPVFRLNTLNESSVANNNNNNNDDSRISSGVQLRNSNIGENHKAAFFPCSKGIEASDNEVIEISDSEDDENAKFKLCTNPQCDVKHYHGPENSLAYSILLANENFNQPNGDSNGARVSNQHPLAYSDPAVGNCGFLVLPPESHNDYLRQSVLYNMGQPAVDRNDYSTRDKSQNYFPYGTIKVTIEHLPPQPKIDRNAREQQTLSSPGSSFSKSNTNFDMSAPLNLSMKNQNENNQMRSTPLASAIETVDIKNKVDILPKSIKTSENNKDDLVFNCRICSNTYKTKGSLEVHMNLHRESVSYKCMYCGQHFPTKIHLLDHIQMHIDNWPFKCNVCGNSFRRHCLLKKHTLAAHGISLPSKANKRTKHVCDQCGYVITNIRGLKTHMKKEHPVITPRVSI